MNLPYTVTDQLFNDGGEIRKRKPLFNVPVPEKLLARKSPRLSFQQAAALPQAGLLAIQGLRFHGDVKRVNTFLSMARVVAWARWRSPI